MSKNKIISQVMTEIEDGKLTMRPRWYFVLYQTSLFVLSTIGVFGLIFIFNFIVFLLRKRGPGYGKILEIYNTLPWWLLPILIFTTLLGYFAYRRADLSYKLSPRIKIIFLALVIVAGFSLFELTGFDEVWSRSSKMRYNRKQYDQNLVPRQKWQSPQPF